VIAKYRKAEYPGEWWLTDFTMEQVERRMATLESRVRKLEAERDRLKDENEFMAEQLDLAANKHLKNLFDIAKLRTRHAALVKAAKSVLDYVNITFCYESDWTTLMREKFDKLKSALAEVK
jgi:predicted  nucleic acid-binding Zn-ribbon protein